MRAAALLVALGAPLAAHEVITTRLTWSREISRIVYKRCVACHREGGKAPMSLLTYAEARPWAKAIREEVLERRMPPWGAVKGFGDFRDDVSLTQEEIMLLADWVEGGAPEGDPALMPYPPDPRNAPASRAANGRSIVVKGTRALTAATVVRAIRPAGLAEGASVRVVAERPDGAIEPLLWLLNYQPKWRRTYAYREPLRLPAGTLVKLLPPEAGAVTLIAAAADPGGRR